ncbi:MAG: hypothetical protein QOK21_1786 [Solirubrobacteraceae bacterium]|nr:hypothetical protein [Solirubrobacteraceae bacterium]
MTEPLEQPATSPLNAVSNALVALHKEQFGRGPTRAQTHFAGPDALLCILEDALLPAERKMAETGESQRVRESRIAFQVATSADFIAAIERILQRKVVAFSSTTDVDNDVVFENFVFEPVGTDGNGGPAPQR